MTRQGRLVSGFIVVCLGLGLMLSPAEAAQSRYPSFVDDDWDPVQRRELPTPSRVDTLFCFASSGAGAWGMPGTDERGYTFDLGGAAEAAGWTSIDESAQTGDHWHVHSAHLVDGHGTDISGADPFDPGDLVNDYALWCGRENVSNWERDDGYGNNWEQWAILDCGNWSTSVTVDFKYISDFEGGVADLFEVLLEVDGDLVSLYTNSTCRDQTLRDLSVSANAGDYPGQDVGDLYFYFTSDKSASDEDGLYGSDIGGVWIDNVVLTVDGSSSQSDFETGALPTWISASAPAGAGDFAALYSNLYSEDPITTNTTNAWAFFDLGTSNPDYPIPVIAYGPPYVNNSIVSPVLDHMHDLGDGVGQPLALGSNSKVYISYWSYLDNPLSGLVFQTWAVAAQVGGTLGRFVDNNKDYFSEAKQWLGRRRNVNWELARSANGGIIEGIVVKLNVVDMYDQWFGRYSLDVEHTPAPYFDNVRVMIIEDSSFGWVVGGGNRPQSSFDRITAGTVRIDSAINIEPLCSPTPVFGDSIVIGLNMDRLGGIDSEFNPMAGEMRPTLYLIYRVIAGPHTGSTQHWLMADQDATDGIYSPTVGTEFIGMDEWNLMQADYPYDQANPPPADLFAFDFNDEYFEPGDVIEFFYRARSVDGSAETYPRWPMSSDPELRVYHHVRCLPTSGSPILFVEDGVGLLPYWREAFAYGGFGNYDVFTTQSPGTGQNNGLAAQAMVDNLDSYSVVIWDTGNHPEFTITDDWPVDKTFDTELLTDWLENSTQKVSLWVMGNRIGNDLGDSSPFVSGVLGSDLLSESSYLDIYGILVPKVYTLHPNLLLDRCFYVDGGGPTVERFSLVGPNTGNPFAVEAFAWETASIDEFAGIFNRDPDGNGLPTNGQYVENWVLYNPFSYAHVFEGDCGEVAGKIYAREVVRDVLESLFSLPPDMAPDAVPEGAPAITQLLGNYPNPFNPETRIRFSLAAPEHVRLTVYDLAGRLVRTLQDGPLDPAHYELVWDGMGDGGRRVASGVYFYALWAGGYRGEGKMILLQ